MFGAPFYHSTTRNLVVSFGNIFNDITIVRKKEDGSEYERFKVPIEYAPKQKWWSVLKEQPDNIKRNRMKVPRIGFEISGMDYDPSRKLNVFDKILYSNSDGTEHKCTFTGVPYIWHFELNVIALNADESFQVVEQILPYFAPSMTITVNALPEMEHKDDVPIALVEVAKMDEYEGGFEQLRMQTFTLKFDVRGFVYAAVRDAKVIKRAQVDLLVAPGNGPVTAEEVSTTPRTVRITTVPDPLDASPTDDYGFTITVQEYFDGLKYNPVTDQDEEPPIE